MDILKIGAAVGIVVILAATYYLGDRSGAGRVQIKWQADKLAQAAALAVQESAHRAQERQWADSLTQIIDAHSAAQEATRHEYENTIAGIESGTLRLRERFRACEQRVPTTPDSAGGDHGGDGGGLLRADQELALRIGREADRVVHRLTACQDYVRALSPD